MLVHQASTSGSGTSACRAGVALLTPPLNVALQVQPIVPLRYLVDSKVSPGRSSVNFRQHFIHPAAGNDCLRRLSFSVS
jgi:hypothetical protein